jgi:hypothetical protein
MEAEAAIEDAAETEIETEAEIEDGIEATAPPARAASKLKAPLRSWGSYKLPVEGLLNQ